MDENELFREFIDFVKEEYDEEKQEIAIELVNDFCVENNINFKEVFLPEDERFDLDEYEDDEEIFDEED